ncbi:MAG: RES domain-containing protein, partial [Verrucomicrobiota bacterium]
VDWVHNEAYTRLVGDRWVKHSVSAVLQVPSAVVNLESNFLLNPSHKNLNIKILATYDFKFDDRLAR